MGDLPMLNAATKAPFQNRLALPPMVSHSQVKMLDETRKAALGALLIQASAFWHGALNDALSRQGQGFAAGAAGELLLLVPADGIAQTLLTRQTGLSKQAVQQMLDRLEAEGAVRREPDPDDRRAKRILPTEKGLAARDSRRSLEAVLEADLRKTLGKKLHGRLRKGLRRLGAPDGIESSASPANGPSRPKA